MLCAIGKAASKETLGWPHLLSPVPPAIAAWIAITRESASASATSASAKMFVYDSGAPVGLCCLPVTTLYLTTPCILSDAVSAGL